MAITVVSQTRVHVSSGNASLGSYTVALNDVVSFGVHANTNFGQAAIVITKTAGTATIGTVQTRSEGESPWGGQFSILDVVITAAGTITFQVSGAPFNDHLDGRAFIMTGNDISSNVAVLAGTATHGTSTTNNINVGGTTTVNDAIVIGGGTEWNDLGTPTSSDMTDFTGFNGAGGSMSGGSGYKLISTAGAYTVNLDAAGSGAAGPWNWATVAYAPAGGAAPAIQYWGMRGR